MTHRRTAPLSAIALLTTLAPTSALGATYYASPNGNGDGTSEDSPASVSSAVNSAQPGDTVYFRAGLYSGWSGTIHPVRSGTADAWITFEAYPGELPIFDTGGVGSGTHEYLRYVGLVSRNGSSGGFGNGWTDGNCSQMSNSNIQYINCIADNNGINGIAHYCASGVLIKQSIIAHNGNQDPSWSSGVNLFAVQGSPDSNVVEQCVSFENLDISTHKSDGSGFILDQNSTGATFVNNIGFRNGGSCIRITNSPNAQIINNTCVNNGVDPNVDYHDEIFFSDQTSRTGALLRNNLCIPTDGQRGLAMGDGVPSENNEFSGTTSMLVSATGTLDFHLADGASPIDAAASGPPTPVEDIGFDWRCIKEASGQAVSWWSYAVDYDYIESIGGVAACFNPGARPSAPDIGAYEFGATTPTGGAGGTPTTGGAPVTGGGGSVTGGAFTTGGAATGPTCQAPLVLCGGTCVNPLTNALHCGICGQACPDGSVCSAGACDSVCAVPLTRCDRACVDTQSDILACGDCGVVCGGGQSCVQGLCTGESTGEDPTVPVDFAVPSGAEDESGCACATRRTPNNGAWLGLGLALALFGRRRRR